MVSRTIFLLLLPLAAAAAEAPRVESGVVLMPGETLVAPPGPVAAPRAAPPAAPKPAPRAPQYSRDEMTRDRYARSPRNVCVNCAVVTAIERRDAHWEVRVRFDDGSRETLRYYELPDLRVGDSVHLEDGRLIRE